MYKKSKYRAQRKEVDNISFDSKKEAKRYLELKALKESGEIHFFLTQVPFRLPGKIRYLVDFMIFWEDGKMSLEDCKGFMTPVSKNKIKQVEELYKVEINIV